VAVQVVDSNRPFATIKSSRRTSAFRYAPLAAVKALLARREDLIVANGRSSPRPGRPPRLTAARRLRIGLFGPVTTVVVDAVSYLFSAQQSARSAGASRAPCEPTRHGFEPATCSKAAVHPDQPRRSAAVLHTILVNGLIMATSPLIAVLMLAVSGFAPWQYGLAFGAPCVGGLIGSRLARPLAARFGQHKVMLIVGALRACWPLGLAFIRPGAAGSCSSSPSSLVWSPA